ncbi:carboxypeptidase regulatory-like domain-containing protein [Planctomycetes bacterium Pla133]|uniref:Nickel uptake substrate-specific transmembrane region n=1 Tax=Engelhardtia mirabilis TaxID=2528011 RepID=A0A518BL92_9BACT|nr:Nickel uptake substrate-specific transmembrane region [Planctomycetes bacterium Pla133]QDV02061.1 Nickel uptake substrate-specific transmembrane region [Planctomycetes bacterium Pla86]
MVLVSLVAVAALGWLVLSPGGPGVDVAQPEGLAQGTGAEPGAQPPAGDQGLANTTSISSSPSASERDRARGTVGTGGGRSLLIGSGDPASEGALEAGPMSWVEGRLRDVTSGAPIRGVNVGLAIEGRDVGTQSGEDGRFRLPWPQGVLARFTVRDKRYVDLTREGLTAPLELELELMPSATLKLDLQPPPDELEDAEFRLWLRDSGRKGDWPARVGEPLHAESGEVWVIFADLDPGEYALAGRVGERFVPFRAGLNLAPGELRTEGVDLERGGRLWGTVRREDGSPIEAAEVELSLRGSGMPRDAEGELRLETSTAADGSFELPPAAPGSYRLEVRSPWGANYLEVVELVSSSTAIEREVVLAPPTSLLGTVVDPRGRPVAEAQVRVISRRERSQLAGLLDQDPVDGAYQVATTGRDGVFTVESLPVGEFLLGVAIPPPGREDLVPAQVEIGRLEAGAAAEAVTLVLRGGRTIEGEVTDATSGEGIAGAAVELVYPTGRAELHWRATESDAMGRFGLEGAMDGVASVRVSALGYRPGRLTVPVAEDTPEPFARLELVPAAELRVDVVDEDGFAWGSLQVRASPALAPGASADEIKAAKSLRLTRTTDSAGVARFDALAHGPVELSLPGGRYEVVELQPRHPFLPDDAQVRLIARALPREETAILSGSAVLSESGAPVPSLAVLGPEGGVLRRDGEHFELSGVVPGPVVVRLEAPGRLPVAIGPIDVFPGAEVDLGAHALRPAVRLEVRLRDENDEPLNGAKVRLLPLPQAAGGVGADAERVVLRRGANGRYESEFGEAGAWTLHVSHPDYRTRRLTVVIPSEASWSNQVKLVPR